MLEQCPGSEPLEEEESSMTQPCDTKVTDVWDPDYFEKEDSDKSFNDEPGFETPPPSQGEESDAPSPRKRQKRSSPVTPRKMKVIPQATDSPSKSSYTSADDIMLLKLHERSMKWDNIAEYFPGRTANALRLHYAKHLKDVDTTALLQDSEESQTSVKGGYTANQDKALLMLRDVKNLPWNEIALLMPGRTSNAIRLHYAKLKKNS